ncbi:hypothetical protein JoomaDRAFT_2152 [Galbibacter orientalis DSM 19592]|uniref:Uncharacterized protein n=1 Tax=Galbibacter orientalis DSM 19592 TaxID=926559 RepID=I3C6A1_9FLAO|nr:hypothetical protein JoomaDRAFT_2152 [Galbibacter orientalis DSM 19592]
MLYRYFNPLLRVVLSPQKPVQSLPKGSRLKWIRIFFFEYLVGLSRVYFYKLKVSDKVTFVFLLSIAATEVSPVLYN